MVSVTTLTIPSSASIAPSDPILIALPSGTIAADFLSSGASVRAFNTDYPITVTVSSSGFAFNWPSTHSLPAGGTAVLQVRNSLQGEPLGPSEQHIGALGGHAAVVSDNFTRPANTTAYASGDLVADNATAGSVTPMSFEIGRTGTAGGMIRRARLLKSGTGVTNALFRLHLYSASPTVANGDNGAWSSNKAADYLGSIDVSVDKAFTDGAAGNGQPGVGSEINFTDQTVYGLLEARGAYTPASAEVFTVDLEVIQN